MSELELDERSLKILHHLVESYIQDGQPVGSKVLAERSQLQLSPATIRNIMADLEAAGLLSSPHTSAGRIPTVEGYRLFANHLLTTQLSHQLSLEDFRDQFVEDNANINPIGRASSLLSKLTQLVGVVTVPKYEKLILKQVEFLRLSEKRLLVILILNDYEVQNRIIETDRDFTRRELEEIGNYLTERFAEYDLLSVREDLLKQLQEQRADLEAMLKTIMEMAEKTQEKSGEYILSGETNLFNAVSSDEYHQLHSLFEAFSQKHDILHLLDRSLLTQGIKIFIGHESAHSLLKDYSIVTAPYSVNNKVIGVLGVIGPTRMSYHRVISAVDVTSKLLSQFLE